MSCYVTIGTCVSSTAFTAVAVGELDAVVGPPGVAGIRQTLVDVALAALAHVARRAHALVAPDAIHALAVVEALGLVCERVGRGVAVVQVDLTVDTCSRQTRWVRTHVYRIYVGHL